MSWLVLKYAKWRKLNSPFCLQFPKHYLRKKGESFVTQPSTIQLLLYFAQQSEQKMRETCRSTKYKLVIALLCPAI